MSMVRMGGKLTAETSLLEKMYFVRSVTEYALGGNIFKSNILLANETY